MIPLPTLYYFLCYAWNRLPEPAVLQASEAAPFQRPLGLLAQVLLHATRRLLRTGLPRTFPTQEAELTSLRGRMELAPTLGRGLLEQGRAICTFDELSAASPLHRLLAQTLGVLARRGPAPGVAPGAAPGSPAVSGRPADATRPRPRRYVPGAAAAAAGWPGGFSAARVRAGVANGAARARRQRPAAASPISGATRY